MSGRFHNLKQRFVASTSLTWAVLMQLQVEVFAWSVALRYRLSPRLRRRLATLRAARDLYLNVGCGSSVAPGFVNLDVRSSNPEVLPWDARRRLPFADGSVRGILIEHFFEHLDRNDEVPRLLADCRRVLAPGALLRVVVPDAGRFLRAYASSSPEALAELGWHPLPPDLPTRMDAICHIFIQSGEHKWAYDFESLSRLLGDFGFVEMQQRGFRESGDPRLAIDLENHRKYSLYVEAKAA